VNLAPWLASMRPPDIAALAFFLIFWLGYEPLLRALSRRGGAINRDMTVIRAAWMRNMAMGDQRLMDANLMGHALNSASFFASSNLILIAAVVGVLFGGETSFRTASSLVLIKTSSRLLFETKLALVLIALARGLLDLIWSIRQMNYTLAAIGAAPPPGDRRLEAYGRAAAGLLNPALSSFNAGVRGYYFALAAAAWLFGGVAFFLATAGAMAMLLMRQRRSPASRAIRRLRILIGEGPGEPEPKP
jgi:uncharacterized membrane protein